MSERKLYQRSALAAGASDLIYLSRADGSADGSCALSGLTSTLGGLLDSRFAAASHTHAIGDVTGLQAALDAKLAASSYTAADVLTKLLTVDGSGSGLDADTLDGISSAGFALASHTHTLSQITDAGTLAGLSTVTEANQTLADNTTGDVSTTKHGYAPKAPNDATKYLDGTGAWSVPAGSGGVSDGDKGDVVVSSSGTVWSLDTTGVSAGTYRSVTVDTKGRVTAGTGFRGALVTKSADQTAADYTSNPTYVAWDTESYDTDSIHDNSSNNSRLTVPSGVTKVRLRGCLNLGSVTAGVNVLAEIDKNGSTTAYTGRAVASTQCPQSFPALNLSSPVLTVTAGDYFQLRLLVQTDNSVTVVKDDSWFAMEIIE